MASSSQNSFSWVDPSTGTRYWGAEAGQRMVAHMTGAPAKGLPPGPLGAPPPPPGTYDPSIDYNAGAAQRGYDNTRDDASTVYGQGQEDYGLNLGDLTRGRDRNLSDILTGAQRSKEDFAQAAGDTRRQYGILGRQQGERAAQQGVTSQGLLGKSNAVRSENQGNDLARIQVQEARADADFGRAYERTGEDFGQNKTRLDLGFGRQFGGFQGNSFNNPLTGQPMVGSLLTNLTRTGSENNAFQTFSAGQRAGQAAQNGYIAPGTSQNTPSAEAAREFTRRLRGR